MPRRQNPKTSLLPLFILATSALAAPAAAPAPEPTAAPILDERALLAITNPAQLARSLALLSAAPATAQASGYANLLSAIKPSATPTNEADAASRLSGLHAAFPSSYLAAGPALLLSGMTGETSFGDIQDDIEAFGPCNNANNVNPLQPDRVIYPRASPSDPTYSVDENTLRSAIFIPPNFTYGRVQPALFFPGTGVEACEDFVPNLGKLFAGSDYADPVYVNPQGNTLQDAQVAAEYVSYAVNYISAITGNSNVSVITWSQGAISAQWAFKYFKSSRNYVSDHVSISPDYHGTIEVPLICPPGFPCGPSVIQQNYNANYIQTLRAHGGTNPYVPTTEIHNIFDEIVEPQFDPIASAHLDGDTTNVQIQNICAPGTLAGGPNFGHENALYNPVTFAVAKDALTHAGPADVGRSGAAGMCDMFMAPGLSLADVFATEALIPLAGFNIETYPSKVVAEPPIMRYAATDAPFGAPIAN